MSPTTAPSRTRFRTHQGPVPAGISSPLFRKLVSEWINLNADPTIAAATRRLGQQQPALAAYNTPGEIVDAIDAGDIATADAMLVALLTLFQDGHQLAGRILLQQFLPLVASISYGTKRGTEAQWTEDRRHIAIAELWNVAATVDIDRYRGRVLVDIHWRLRRHFLKATNDSTREIPCGDAGDILDHDTSAHYHDDDEPLISDSYRLAPILAWAQASGLITQADADLLTTIYIDGNRINKTAAQMGLKPTNVSQRCHRAVKRIRDHIDQIPTPAAIA